MGPWRWLKSTIATPRMRFVEEDGPRRFGLWREAEEAGLVEEIETGRDGGADEEDAEAMMDE